MPARMAGSAALWGVLGLAAVVVGLDGLRPAAADTPRRPEALTLAPLEFTPLPVEKAMLACGIPVYLLQNHDLPLLDLTIRFRMGSRYVGVAEQAAVRILGDLWRSGGTTALPPDSLDEVLAALDARIVSGVDLLTGGVALYSSSGDLERTLPLWRDVVLHPRFDRDRLARARANRLKDLQAMNDSPGRIASVHMEWLLWGRDYPAVHRETRTELDAVTGEALTALHRRFVHPSGAVIGVSGDFDRGEILRKLDELFTSWPTEGFTGPPVKEEWPIDPRPGVYLLRGDFEQSHVQLGKPLRGLSRDSADYGAAQILSYAFGFLRVHFRTREEGLSYASAVMLAIGNERSSQLGFGSCRPEVTTRLIQVAREEMERLGKEPLSDQEVENARVFHIGGLVSESETASQLIAHRVENVIQGRPDDYDLQYLRQLQSTKAADLEALAGRYLTFDEESIVLVLGDPGKFDVPLDSLGLGPVRELEPVRFGE